MNAESALKFAEEWQAAWNSHDVSDYYGLTAEGIAVDPAWLPRRSQ